MCQYRVRNVGSKEFTHLFDLFGDRIYESLAAGSPSIPLEAYGYRWFRVDRN
jgi:maltose alpha-D-glucosyltransferase/alpha-amylase